MDNKFKNLTQKILDVIDSIYTLNRITTIEENLVCLQW